MTPNALAAVDTPANPRFLSDRPYLRGIAPSYRLLVNPLPIGYLTEPPQLASWFLDIRDKIRGYLELVPNWDSYGGGPISREVVDNAERFAEVMARSGFSRPNVCPESSGGILLEWLRRGQALTVDIASDNEGLSFSYESAETPESEGDGRDFLELVRGGFLQHPF